jgi:hypothetical protein
MSYPFCCPQGHELHAELTAIGQVAQCPVCGANFLVPPPDYGAVSTRNAERLPGLWASGAAANLPIAIAVEPRPTDAGADAPAGSAEAGTAQEMPPMARGAANESAPFEPAIGPTETESPAVDLGFDPFAKAALPFDLPRQADTVFPGPAAASPLPADLPGSFLAASAPVDPMPAPALPASPSPAGDSAARPANAPGSNATGPEFLAGVSALSEESAAAPLPKTLHIRCPAGHILKAPSDLLGRLGRCPACKKTFELRYEDSIEFQRRTAGILRRDQYEAGRVWVAWTFAVVFLAFVGLAGAVLILR